MVFIRIRLHGAISPRHKHRPCFPAWKTTQKCRGVIKLKYNLIVIGAILNIAMKTISPTSNQKIPLG